MGQNGVDEEEGGAAGFRLGDGVGQQIFSVGEIGGDDDFAGRGERGADVVERKGHGCTSHSVASAG